MKQRVSTKWIAAGVVAATFMLALWIASSGRDAGQPPMTGSPAEGLTDEAEELEERHDDARQQERDPRDEQQREVEAEPAYRLRLLAPVAETVPDAVAWAGSIGHISEQGESPHSVTITTPEGATYTSWSRRTTIWTTEGHVTGVTVLPMAEAAESQAQVAGHLADLLEQWEIEPTGRLRQMLDRTARIERGGNWQHAGMRVSPTMNLRAYMRSSGTGQWFLAIDFNANVDETARLREEAWVVRLAAAEERVRDEVLGDARTPGERVARIDAFLADPPEWFTDSLGRGMSNSPTGAFRHVLADAIVSDAGAAGITLLTQARIEEWRKVAKEHPGALAEFLARLDPDEVLQDEWLYRTLTSLSRNPNLYEVSEPEVLRVGVHESMLHGSAMPPPPALGTQG